jgi:hypothetical protein
MITLDYLRMHILPPINKKDLHVAENIILRAPTETEVRQKAQELVATIDPYRQPSIMSVYQHVSGDWVATIVHYGLD